MIKINGYPRPQFIRNNWINLNGEWNFLFDDDNIGEINEYYIRFPESLKIEIPFTYETKLSGIADETIHENIWYQKDIIIKNIDEEKRIIINFEGSDFITKLWVNGKYVGINIGGYHRFSFDITDFLKNGINNFTIKVHDSLSMSQPRGKQRYKYDSWECWYVQTTGIWKTIWIENVSKNYILSAKNTPNYDNKSIEVECFTNISENGQDCFEIQTEIVYENSIINVDRHDITNKVSNYKMNICGVDSNHEIKYWSPENPHLYNINYKLYKNGHLIDEVKSYFGVRKISIENSKILLNGKEIYLKMILDQGYWPDSHLTPPNEDAIIKDLEIVKKYGFNGIRKHQKIEDERFLYYCDINGILVWSEMASCYEFNDQSIEYFNNEWVKIVKQNYNHPCIITWVPINESWGVREISFNKKEQNFVNSLYYITKAIDKTRPVITNDGWEHTISDIITIHDYKQDVEELKNLYKNHKEDIIQNNENFKTNHAVFSENYKYSGQPIIMSEYGGIALNSNDGWGYGKQAKDELEFIERFEKITTVLKNIPYLSGYCYTQLTDVQQEINGLVDEYRKNKFSNEIINRISYVNRNGSVNDE